LVFVILILKQNFFEHKRKIRKNEEKLSPPVENVYNHYSDKERGG